MSLISVIVPCYNVSLYIDRCVESIVNQTIGIENLEIILVNDASTDDTFSKMKRWEEKYPNQIIVVTYDENIRQGGARNVGLSYAGSPYIGFVDADDWIDRDMYRILYERMKSGSYDVVKCKFMRAYAGDCYTDYKKEKDEDYVFEKRNGLAFGIVDRCGNNGGYGGIWSGLYKREVIFDNAVVFPEGLSFEDNFWSAMLNLYVTRLYIVDKVLYYYFANPDSTINAYDKGYYFDRLKIELMKLEEYKKRGAFELWHDEIEWDFIRLYFINTWYIFFTRFSYIPDVYKEMKDTVLKYFPEWQNNPYLYKANAVTEKFYLDMLSKEGYYEAGELQQIKSVWLKYFG